jgi:hypothetical protein
MRIYKTPSGTYVPHLSTTEHVSIEAWVRLGHHIVAVVAEAQDVGVPHRDKVIADFSLTSHTLTPRHTLESGIHGYLVPPLSAKQRIEVDALRDKVLTYLIAETEALYKRHPAIQVNWSFGLDATLRESVAAP